MSMAFLVTQRDSGYPPIATTAIIPGLSYGEDEYVSRPSKRDFLYLTRRR